VTLPRTAERIDHGSFFLQQSLDPTPANSRSAQTARIFQRCPICHSALTPSRIVVPEGPLLECPNCGQLLSGCDTEQYNAALQMWNTAHGTSPQPRAVRRYREVVSRRLRKAERLLGHRAGMKLLDVGCSSGALLAIAKDLGFEVWGVEPAHEAAQTAIRAGFDVHEGYLSDARYPDGQFDVITLFEIVEHLRDPIEVVAECARILKPGGILVVNTPNAHSWSAETLGGQWEGFSLFGLGGHISFFSPRSMGELAKRTGLAVEWIETRNVRLTEDKSSPVKYRALKILGQLLAYPARIASKGHDLLVYFRKPGK
jgi:SAM-dependent methyltransferase